MKSGFKTSEFSFGTGGVGAIVFLAQHESITPVVRAAAILAIAMIVSAYALSRGGAKFTAPFDVCPVVRPSRNTGRET